MFAFLLKHRLTKSESTRIKIAWALRFLYQVGLVSSWTIITALFVQTFGIENLLWLFAIEAFLYLIGSIFSSFFYRRLSIDTYTYALLFGAGGLALVALFWATYHGVGPVFFVLAFLAKSVFYNQLNIALYRRNEKFFSPTEAVKFMPIVESAVTLGGIAGAGLLVASLYVVDSLQVLYIWFLTCLSMAVLVKNIDSCLHLLPKLDNQPSQSIGPDFSESIKEAFKISFVRHMMVFLLLQTIVFTYLDVSLTQKLQKEIAHHSAEAYQLHDKENVLPHLKTSIFETVETGVNHVKSGTQKAIDFVSHDFIMHETLAHDLGVFHLMFGVIALFVQLVITSPILRSFGVVGAMAVNSLLVLLSGIGMALGYLDIKWASSVRHGTHSIGETAYHVSYYSLFSEKRESIRLFFEGIMRPAGILIMVLLLHFFSAKDLVILVPMIGVLLLLIGIHMKRAYTELSHKNMIDHQVLSSKLHAIEVMGQRGHSGAVNMLSRQLKDKSQHGLVRQKIIKTLTGVQSPLVLPTYVEILADPKESEEVKMKILDSMLQIKRLRNYLEDHAFSRHHLLQVLRSLFQETQSSHLKKLLVMNIFCHLPSDQVVPFFLETMKHADEKLQSIYLRSCKVFADPSLGFYLQSYLESESYRIQGHAIIALWNSGDRKALKLKIKQLLASQDKDALVAALYAIGEIDETGFKAELKKSLEHADEEIKLHASIALGKLGDHSVIETLASFMMKPEGKISSMAIGMIERVPADIRNDVLHQLRKGVSMRVAEILMEPVNQNAPVEKLNQNTLFALQRLYGLVGQLDDLVVIENALKKA